MRDGLERKIGGGSLIQRNFDTMPSSAPGKRTLTEKLGISTGYGPSVGRPPETTHPRASESPAGGAKHASSKSAASAEGSAHLTEIEGGDAAQAQANKGERPESHHSDEYNDAASEKMDLESINSGDRGSVAAPTGEENDAAKSASRFAKRAKPDHYAILLKAWIPQEHVVDPEDPARKDEWLEVITKIANTVLFPFPGTPKLKYDFKSRYRGDNHPGFDGGFRVQSFVEFYFDGHKITNFKHHGHAGATHRDWSRHAWLESSLPVIGTIFKLDIVNEHGTETKTATGNWPGHHAGSNRFHFSIDSSNPVVMTVAPAISSDIYGAVSSRGLVLNYATDEFPSHGLRVVKNGSPITWILEDASKVDVTGIDGAANIFERLTSQDNRGHLVIP